MKRLRLSLTLVLALLLVAVSVAGASSARGRVLPPDTRLYGLTSADWAAVVWQAVLSIPAPENPVVGAPWTDCFLERIGNVGLGLGFALPSGTFTCEMPSGMTLYQMFLTVECSTLEAPPFYGGTPKELRDCAQSIVITNAQATIDGVPVPGLNRYFITSPLFRFTVPDDNILGVPAGSGYSVAQGINLMIAPLSPGQHTMHLHAEVPSLGVVYDWTYFMTVTP